MCAYICHNKTSCFVQLIATAKSMLSSCERYVYKVHTTVLEIEENLGSKSSAYSKLSI